MDTVRSRHIAGCDTGGLTIFMMLTATASLCSMLYSGLHNGAGNGAHRVSVLLHTRTGVQLECSHLYTCEARCSSSPMLPSALYQASFTCHAHDKHMRASGSVGSAVYTAGTYRCLHSLLCHAPVHPHAHAHAHGPMPHATVR